MPATPPPQPAAPAAADAASPEDASPDPNPACLNCGAPVTGAYCARCGQEAETAGRLSARLTFHDLVDEFVKIDAGFFRTARLLVFRPGLLTADYLAGRRARHLAPAKLYLLVNFVFFLVVQWADPITAEIVAEDYVGKEAFRNAAQAHGMTQAAFGQGVEGRIADAMPTWLFVLVPVLAVLLKGLHLRSRRPFAAHAVFAFHFMAFALLALLPGALAPASVAEPVYNASLLGALPLWLGLGLRRAYGQGWIATAAKTGVLWLAFVVLIWVYLSNVVAWAVGAG